MEGGSLSSTNGAIPVIDGNIGLSSRPTTAISKILTLRDSFGEPVVDNGNILQMSNHTKTILALEEIQSHLQQQRTGRVQNFCGSQTARSHTYPHLTNSGSHNSTYSQLPRSRALTQAKQQRPPHLLSPFSPSPPRDIFKDGLPSQPSVRSQIADMASQRQGVRVDTSGLAPVSKKVLREKILEQVIQESIILRDNVQTSMEKTSELQKVVDDLKQRLRLEKTQKVVLEQQLVEAKAAITDLEVANQRQQEISKHALNSKVNEVVELKRLANLNQLKFERAVKQSKMVKGQLSSTISDIDNLQRQVQQKQDVINFKEQEKDRLLYSSERLCELTRAQGEKIMDAKYHNRFSRQREAAALLNEREMKDRFTGVVEELHAKESECNTLSEQLVTTKNELALLGGLWERKFNTAMTKAAAEQADLKIELQQAQDKAVRIQEALQQQKDSYEKTIATLKSNIEEYLQVIETAEKAKSRMQKEIDEFESVRAEDVMKQSNMGAQLRALNQNRQELEAEVKELTKEKTELTEDKERHLAKIEKLNKAVEVMERQSKELKQQLERKEERLQDARSQVRRSQDDEGSCCTGCS